MPITELLFILGLVGEGEEAPATGGSLTMSVALALYGTAFVFDGFALVTRDAQDLKAAPTLAAGDAKISKDGGAAANLATLPSVVPSGGTNIRVPFSSGEMTCKMASVTFIDQTAPKEWEDNRCLVMTFGHASAAIPALPANLTQVAGDAAVPSTFLRALQSEYVGTVTGATTATTTTDSALTQSSAGHWNGRVIIFITGALAKQQQPITGFDPATDRLTHGAFTGAAASGDVYVIV